MLDVLLAAIPISFAGLFAILNPFSNSFIFLTLTEHIDSATRRILARKIAIYTAITLVLVTFCGSWVLRFFGITIPIIQLGGGLIVCAIGWNLLNHPNENDTANHSIRTKEEALEQAYFPLTMPLIAGPGSMAVTLTLSAQQITESWKTTLMGELGLVIAIFMIAINLYFCFSYADRLTAKLGKKGTNVIIKLSVFLLFCIGISIIWHGVQGLLHLN